MTSSIKVRTSMRDGITTVRAIIRHPMHTGYESDPDTGELIPAHFIENVTAYHGDKIILRCDWSRAISTNPYLSFEFSGAQAGDILRITWLDNMGETDSLELKVE